jgi:hypothetical protein
MGYDTPDVYYQPEKFDLKPVFELDLMGGNGCYEFDILAVWQDINDGSLWFATDGGCSCPAPFEDYTSREDLDSFELDTVVAIVKESTVGDYRSYGLSEAQADEAIQRLERLSRA